MKDVFVIDRRAYTTYIEKHPFIVFYPLKHDDPLQEIQGNQDVFNPTNLSIPEVVLFEYLGGKGIFAHFPNNKYQLFTDVNQNLYDTPKAQLEVIRSLGFNPTLCVGMQLHDFALSSRIPFLSNLNES